MRDGGMLAIDPRSKRKTPGMDLANAATDREVNR
jgi:hypothetical protein